MKEIKESTQKEREQKKQRTRQLEHTYTHEKWGKKWPSRALCLLFTEDLPSNTKTNWRRRIGQLTKIKIKTAGISIAQ